ncbi:hypothetical protein [Paucibacter sp. DJ2R-2]|uniref:hypothetical protein n=1 Tax=Paucibacter sp. DJ2R-2 TaxID=2893558 RepID=UPI0021E46814|nr:hypothetical protein [Paucibacter sp. DJ2R-2]MCV2423101.1 hypothetical protein [Paucibacter sp. DJ4R-1]MCV2440997.1 hypothetical protein [Paucibacter sp. DJ2R-2]
MLSAQQFRRRWLAPLIFFQLYLSLTVFLFFYGPWPWEVEHPAKLWTFLATAQIAIAAGYMLAWNTVDRATQSPQDIAAGVKSGISFLKVATIITIVMAIPSSLSRTGNWYPDIFRGVESAGVAYNENFERLDTGNAFVVVEYLRMLLSYFLTAVFPLAVVYWGKMTIAERTISSLAIAFNLSLYISTGTNKGIADFVVTLPWLIALAFSCGTLRIPRIKFVAPIAFIAMFTGFLFFFGEGQQQREGSGTEYSSFFTGLAVLQASGDHFISNLLPESGRIIFESLSRYVVQGYFALSLALEIDSPSTMGFGHSMFLARNADALMGGDFFVNSSLPGILERDHSWPMFLLWHSIYPWLASDFGVLGTLVVMALLAYLFALSWGMAMRTAAPQWITFFYLLLVLFYYIPANNQVFQSGETCLAFFIILFFISKQMIERKGMKR